MTALVIAKSSDTAPLGFICTEPESSALLRLHDSLLQDIFHRTDIQSRISASATCRRLSRVSAEHPPSVVDLSSDGVHPETCRRYIENAKGAIVTLTTARHHQRTACDATSTRRFNTGVRCTQVVPYTSGPSAARLATCLPCLRQLALHEATSCLGGMTDEFAVAVAAHCPLLSSLEVAFTRYSLPSECFTDAGMMALAVGCPRLSSLSLTNCGAITDRSLYAVAVHCRGLTSLVLGGYHELISDYGTVVLFQACPNLARVTLSGKLRRVTDESLEALATTSGAVLRDVKLTRSMTDRSLTALAAHCKALRLVDCCKCDPTELSSWAMAAMIRALSAKFHENHQQLIVNVDGSTMKQDVTTTEVSPSQAACRPAVTCLLEHHTSTVPTATTAPTEILRVVLPKGLAAADVVRHGPGGGGDDAGGGGCASFAPWQAVSPQPAAAAASRDVSPTSASPTAIPTLDSTTGSGATAAKLLLKRAAGMSLGGSNISVNTTRVVTTSGGSAAPTATKARFEEVLVRL